MVINIEIPWPPVALRPNGRVHWAAKARAVKKARSQARLLVLEQIGSNVLKIKRVSGITITAFPRIRGRLPDADNIVASCKATLDGIADALSIDDQNFPAPQVRYGARVEHGKIIVDVFTEENDD